MKIAKCSAKNITEENQVNKEENMPDFLLKAIVSTIITTLIGIIIKGISISKIKKWWEDTRIYKYFKRYQFVDNIKDNQTVFNTFITLSKSNADQSKTEYQKEMYSIQHPLHKAVIREMELWRAIKSSTTSPKEREIINELLSITNIGNTDSFSKSELKTIGDKRLKSCKQYIKILKKYQKTPIENYQVEKLDCLKNYVEATKSYYELLYIYLPIDERNIIEKSFNK